MVDVGARGGLPWQWQPFRRQITAVLVEPDPTEAANLVERMKDSGLRDVKVIDKGLGAGKRGRTQFAAQSGMFLDP